MHDMSWLFLDPMCSCSAVAQTFLLLTDLIHILMPGTYSTQVHKHGCDFFSTQGDDKCIHLNLHMKLDVIQI